jgi:hypothetical protein
VAVTVENCGELPDAESTSNWRVLEVPPPDPGFCTVTETMPALAMSLAGTWAVTCAALTNVVVSDDDPQYTVAPVAKTDPFTVSVNAAPPAVAMGGERLPSTGTAGLTVILTFAVAVV